MTQPWKVMSEQSKPVKGFTYECEFGHSWFIPLAQWESRGDNTCAECAALDEALWFEADALAVAQAEGMA